MENLQSRNIKVGREREGRKGTVDAVNVAMLTVQVNRPQEPVRGTT